MKDKSKITSGNRFVLRRRIVRTIGLDTDILMIFLENGEEYSLFKPKIFNRNNSLFVCYRVVSELIHLLTKNGKLDIKRAKDKIFSFFRQNKIRLIKYSQTNANLVEQILLELKKQRQVNKINAGDSDLRIISIYNSHNIDCIISRNTFHFEPFCKYLNIEYEKPIKDLDIMLKRTFGWQKNRKK